MKSKNKTDFTSIAESLEGFLRTEHCGERMAITAPELQERYRIRSVQLREIVNTMRLNGIPICSGVCGYYYAASAKDVAKTQASMKSRAASIIDAANGMEKAYKLFTPEI